MAFPTSTSGETSKAAASLHPHKRLLFLIASMCGVAGFLISNDLVKLGFWAVGTTLLFVAGWSADCQTQRTNAR